MCFISIIENVYNNKLTNSKICEENLIVSIILVFSYNDNMKCVEDVSKNKYQSKHTYSTFPLLILIQNNILETTTTTTTTTKNEMFEDKISWKGTDNIVIHIIKKKVSLGAIQEPQWATHEYQYEPYGAIQEPLGLSQEPFMSHGWASQEPLWAM